MDKLDRYKRARVERIRTELDGGQFTGNSDGATALRDLLDTIDELTPPPKTVGQLLHGVVTGHDDAWEHARKDIWEERATRFEQALRDEGYSA